jgi:hypothetical protein
MPLRAPLLASLLALVLAGGCTAVEPPGGAAAEQPGTEATADAGAVAAPDAPTGEPTVEAPQAGEDLEVPLDVVEGPEGSTLAFVPVMIDGEGPYGFALDTGASTSVVDAAIAEELGLERVGDAQGVAGVTGATDAILVQVDRWTTGDVELGARPVLVLDLDGVAEGAGLQGLLGSDVLSEFGAITVDYVEGVLRLRPRTG